MSEQLMPADIDAERAALGSVFQDRGAIIPLQNIVPDAAAFHWPANREVYAVMLACLKDRTPADIVTVSGRLARKRATSSHHATLLEEIGGLAYLVELSNSVPTAYHVEYYARQVATAAVLRDVIKAGSDITRLGYNGGSIDEIKAKIDARLRTIATSAQEEGLVPLSQIVDEVYAMLEAARSSGVVGLPTGFKDLDELFGGLQKSDLIILAARPAVGKSAFSLSLAYNVARLQPRHSVAFFALEMSRTQLTQRLLATHAGIDVLKLRTGKIKESDLDALMTAMGEISSLPLHIDHTAAASLTHIRGRCIRMQAEQGLDLVIVDYLQLMGSAGRSENRVQEVSEISRGLKALARELDVPVIALSQLSRAVEGRTSHVPMLSDLRESGALEQDADQVWFIYREELYNPDTDKVGIAEIHISKNRNGPTGIIPLRFFKSTTRFTDLERYRQPEGY